MKQPKPATRYQRRLTVSFRRRGENRNRIGFTTNISTSGMFVATRSIVPAGNRIRLEINGEKGFAVEGEVVWVHSQPLQLRDLRSSGFGVRFLAVADLVREAIGGPTTAETSPPEGVPGANSGKAGVGGKGSGGRGDDGGTPTFRVSFKSPAQFLRVFDRDLKTGGLFLMTGRELPLDTPVTVEIVPPGDAAIAVRCAAKVVFAGERENPDGSANLLAGVGVELRDRDAVLERLAPLAARLRTTS